MRQRPSSVPPVDTPAGSQPVTVGITAGASTPNNKIGETVARIFATRGVRVEDVFAVRD